MTRDSFLAAMRQVAPNNVDIDAKRAWIREVEPHDPELAKMLAAELHQSIGTTEYIQRTYGWGSS